MTCFQFLLGFAPSIFVLERTNRPINQTKNDCNGNRTPAPPNPASGKGVLFAGGLRASSNAPAKRNDHASQSAIYD
jgi:hypothetical protein